MDAKLIQLIKLEKRAQRLSEEMTTTRLKWEKTVNDLKNAGKWEAYCEENNLHPDYTFHDILC